MKTVFLSIFFIIFLTLPLVSFSLFYLVRRSCWYKQELSRLKVHSVAGNIKRFIRTTFKNRIQAVIEHRLKMTCWFWRIKGPLFLPRYQIHPKMGSKCINMETTISSCLLKKIMFIIVCHWCKSWHICNIPKFTQITFVWINIFKCHYFQ